MRISQHVVQQKFLMRQNEGFRVKIASCVVKIYIAGFIQATVFCSSQIDEKWVIIDLAIGRICF
jgi:hypothetical protein